MISSEDRNTLSTAWPAQAPTRSHGPAAWLGIPSKAAGGQGGVRGGGRGGGRGGDKGSLWAVALSLQGCCSGCYGKQVPCQGLGGLGPWREARKQPPGRSHQVRPAALLMSVTLSESPRQRTHTHSTPTSHGGEQPPLAQILLFLGYSFIYN